jgi:hypothetical protein
MKVQTVISPKMQVVLNPEIGNQIINQKRPIFDYKYVSYGNQEYKQIVKKTGIIYPSFY